MDREYNEEERKCLVKEMCRIALRTNEPELRELKQKLENDYIRKNQACQIKENEYRALKEQVEKRHQQLFLLEKEMKYLEIQEQEKKKKFDQKNLYGKDLLEQVNTAEKVHIIEKELEVQKRREELNKLADEIKEDIAKKLGEKIFAVEATRHEMKLFKKTKEIRDLKQSLMSAEESQMIEKTNREIDERFKMTAEEKKRKFELRESLKDRIAANLLAQQVAKEERAQLFRELEEHEYLENSKHTDDSQFNYTYNQRKTVHAMLKAQIQANIDRAYMLKNQEAEYTQQLNREIQKQNEIEESERKVTTLRKQEYAMDIKKQMADNLEKQRLQNETIMMTNEYIKKFNEEKRKQIDEEKELMIKEHNLKVTKSLHYT